METDEVGFLKLYEAGAVKRWHTVTTIKDQDLAAHSWGVAMIVDYLGGSHNALRAALFHDMAECETGDVPYQVKRANVDLDKQIKLIERAFDETYGLDVFLTGHELKLIKWADMFELLLWARREVSLGNYKMGRVANTAIAALEDMGPPSDRADFLLKEAMHG